MRMIHKTRRWLLTAALVCTLMFTGCQSQTAALQEEMSASTEVAATSLAEETSVETEAIETEESSEDEYLDAAWAEAQGETAENLDKYNEKKSDQKETKAARQKETTAAATAAPTTAAPTTEAPATDAETGDYSYTPVDTETGGSPENYYTDDVPEDKPQPVEPQDEEVNENLSLTCTLYVECSTILDNMSDLTEGKESLVPSDGVIYSRQTVTFYSGESVFDILKREMQNHRIHMESEFTAMYNSAYVQGINNLYEFDCGSLSGWMYCVNDWYPNYGCSRYQVQQGDVIEWHYTCDLGRDLGADMSE